MIAATVIGITLVCLQMLDDACKSMLLSVSVSPCTTYFALHGSLSDPDVLIPTTTRPAILSSSPGECFSGMTTNVSLSKRSSPNLIFLSLSPLQLPLGSFKVSTTVIIITGGPPLEKGFTYLSIFMTSSSSSSSMLGRAVDICSIKSCRPVYIQTCYSA